MSNRSIGAMKKAKSSMERALDKFNKAADAVEAALSGALDTLNEGIANAEKSGDEAAPARRSSGRKSGKRKAVGRKPKRGRGGKQHGPAKRPRKDGRGRVSRKSTRSRRPVSEDDDEA